MEAASDTGQAVPGRVAETAGGDPLGRPQAPVLTAGELELRPAEFLARAGERRLALTVREFELLTALVERSGRIVSRAELYEAAWGEPYRTSDRSVDVYVGKLRQKLHRELPDQRFIHTHFGFGYRFWPERSASTDSHRPRS